MSYPTSNLAPGVTGAEDVFFPEEEPADIAYCEDPDCGWSIDAYEIRYDEDPSCPECAGALQPDKPAPSKPSYPSPIPLAARIDGILAGARLRAAIDRDLRKLREDR